MEWNRTIKTSIEIKCHTICNGIFRKFALYLFFFVFCTQNKTTQQTHSTSLNDNDNDNDKKSNEKKLLRTAAHTIQAMTLKMCAVFSNQAHSPCNTIQSTLNKTKRL